MAGIADLRVTAGQDDSTIAVYRSLTQIDQIATGMMGGSIRIEAMLSSWRSVDRIYGEAAPHWQALAGVRTTPETNAMANIKAKLDLLFTAVVAFLNATPLGSGLNTTDRGLPPIDVPIPSGVTTAATNLVVAIEAFPGYVV